MKKCKCRKCHREFDMPDDFIGTILCEDCDPFMNNDSISPKYTSGTSDREEFEKWRAGIKDMSVDVIWQAWQEQQKKIGTLKALNPNVPCPVCGGKGYDTSMSYEGYAVECSYCLHTGTVPLTKAQEYRIEQLEATINRMIEEAR